MTSRQQKLVESYIRRKVRSMLNEAPEPRGKLDRGEYWMIFREVGGNGWEVGKYMNEKIAKDVAAYLTKMAPYEVSTSQSKKYDLEGLKPRYVVKKSI